MAHAGWLRLELEVLSWSATNGWLLVGVGTLSPLVTPWPLQVRAWGPGYQWWAKVGATWYKIAL